MIISKYYCDRCGYLVDETCGRKISITIDKGLHQRYFLCKNCINEYDDLIASAGINFINNKAIHSMAVANWGRRIYNGEVTFSDLPVSSDMKENIAEYLKENEEILKIMKK